MADKKRIVDADHPEMGKNLSSRYPYHGLVSIETPEDRQNRRDAVERQGGKMEGDIELPDDSKPAKVPKRRLP